MSLAPSAPQAHERVHASHADDDDTDALGTRSARANRDARLPQSATKNLGNTMKTLRADGTTTT